MVEFAPLSLEKPTADLQPVHCSYQDIERATIILGTTVFREEAAEGLRANAAAHNEVLIEKNRLEGDLRELQRQAVELAQEIGNTQLNIEKISPQAEKAQDAMDALYRSVEAWLPENQPEPVQTIDCAQTVQIDRVVTPDVPPRPTQPPQALPIAPTAAATQAAEVPRQGSAAPRRWERPITPPPLKRTLGFSALSIVTNRR